MSQPVTFFYRRDQKQGETYDFKVTSSKDIFYFYVYSNVALDPKSTSLRDQSIKDCNLVVRDLQQNLLRQDGGVILALTGSGSRREVRVLLVVGTEANSPSSHFLIVRPGFGPFSLSVGKEWQKVPEICHMVVPVDQPAEEALQRFTEGLSWFPPDLESVVLYALMRPSLDYRVSRLEEKAFGKALGDPDKGQERTRLGERLKDLWSWGWFRAVAIVALTLLVTLIAGIVMRQMRILDNKNIDGKSVQTPKQLIAEFVKNVEKKSESDSDLDALYEAQFADLKNKEVDDIARLLQPRSLISRSVALGIIKLEVARVTQFDVSFMGEPENVTDTKIELDGNKKDALLDDNSVKLLSALACLAYGSPAIPQTDDPRFRAPFEFAPGQKCDRFPLTATVSGLKRLKDEYVAKFPR